MQFLSYLAAQQVVHRLSAEQFDAEPEPKDIQVAVPSRLDHVRSGVAVVLRRTADRVEPADVRS